MSNQPRCTVTDVCIFCGVGVEREVRVSADALPSNMSLLMLGPSGWGTVCEACVTPA